MITIEYTTYSINLSILFFTNPDLIMKNILSIDLESWIHFFEGISPLGKNWFGVERKEADNNFIPSSTIIILDLLEKSENKATFFILGELYDWYPEVINEIRSRGHEVAYHGHDHQLISTSNDLQAQLTLSRTFLNTFRPIGFRAPRLYLQSACMATLKEHGFTYSSSSYGPFQSKRLISNIQELPISTSPWFGHSVDQLHLPRPLSPGLLLKENPFGSGLSANLLGKHTSYFINRQNKKGIPTVLMLHPWQLVPPKQIVGFQARKKMIFNHPLFFPYTLNRGGALQCLLHSHRFISFEKYLIG